MRVCSILVSYFFYIEAQILEHCLLNWPFREIRPNLARYQRSLYSWSHTPLRCPSMARNCSVRIDVRLEEAISVGGLCAERPMIMQNHQVFHHIASVVAMIGRVRDVPAGRNRHRRVHACVTSEETSGNGAVVGKVDIAASSCVS